MVTNYEVAGCSRRNWIKGRIYLCYYYVSQPGSSDEVGDRFIFNFLIFIHLLAYDLFRSWRAREETLWIKEEEKRRINIHSRAREALKRSYGTYLKAW